MAPVSPKSPALLLTAALWLTLSAPALAQAEQVAPTTISAIERGEAAAMVYLEGAALEQVDGETVLFSDGTGVITIDLAMDAKGGMPPLLELIGVEGTVADDTIDASRWVPLRIMTPAVIVEEPQVIEAFRGWIIAYGSQAPAPTE
jgi:hypothetical protein